MIRDARNAAHPTACKYRSIFNGFIKENLGSISDGAGGIEWDIPTRVCGTHVLFIRARGLDVVNGDVLENAKSLDNNLGVSTAPRGR
jgi:hypothetical protein